MANLLNLATEEGTKSLMNYKVGAAIIDGYGNIFKGHSSCVGMESIHAEEDAIVKMLKRYNAFDLATLSLQYGKNERRIVAGKAPRRGTAETAFAKEENYWRRHRWRADPGALLLPSTLLHPDEGACHR